MLGLVKEISGQKTIIPLTTDTGTGASVGTLISQYKKVPMSGYLYCDGSTFDETAYPALYLYLGSNVLPDYRECVMVGAEQNTTDNIAEHDVYTQGQFKDDQMQSHNHYEAANAGGADQTWGNISTSNGQSTGWYTGYIREGRSGITTHGKQKAVYVYIKATSGLAENQQENVLNATKDYVDNTVDDKVGRYPLTAHSTSTGWEATKDLSNFPVGIYKVTAMHSSTGATLEALILRTGYDYVIQNVYTNGSIGISRSGDTISVQETTSSIGVVVVSLNTVGTN